MIGLILLSISLISQNLYTRGLVGVFSAGEENDGNDLMERVRAC